jgi:hypothetical protein
MAVKWTTVLLSALDRKSNAAVTRKTHERTPQNCFHPVKRKSRLKPARFLFGELCGCKNAAIVLTFGASKQAI